MAHGSRGAAGSGQYDLLVIGGGITGAGVARDAALRGLKVALLERGRPGGATTAASTHLIHGGLRYLLYDRLTTHASCLDSGHIVRTAGDLLTRLPILWPVYRDHARGLETVETLLEQYDRFAPMKYGRKHLRLSAHAAAKLVPGLRTEGLLGALVFDEWWVDAEALTRRTLDSARAAGAHINLGSPATGFLQHGRRVVGVKSRGRELRAAVTINAAGPWIKKIAALAGADMPLRLMRGAHLIYRNPALTPFGLLLEAVDRSRYVFVVPSPLGTWVGPTDLPGPDNPDHVRATESEIGYLTRSVRRYFALWPAHHDAVIAGTRPIIGQPGQETLLSRDYDIIDHERESSISGLLTIGGGKMSDYRMMAQDAVDAACVKLGRHLPCRSHLFTLDGNPLSPASKWPRPPRALRHFLRSHPRLRQAHALSYLGAGFAAHFARLLTGRVRPGGESDFRKRYD